jgi:hypothetical protein
MNSHLLFPERRWTRPKWRPGGYPRRSATRRRARRWRDAGAPGRSEGVRHRSRETTRRLVRFGRKKVKGGCFDVTPVWAVYLAHLTHAK